MVRLINEFLIGCDPEFVGLDKDGVIQNQGTRYSEEGQLGTDHNGWVLEFRPRPCRGTYALVRRIARLINGKTLPERVRAGAFVNGGVQGRRNQVLGGHVHLDLSPYPVLETGKIDPAAYHRQIETTGRPYANQHLPRIAALDAFTAYLEALDILPKAESELRRNTTEYGKYGDVRIAGRGRYRTEYRTMASWLYDPKVAMVCLTGAKLAAADPQNTVQALAPAYHFDRLQAWFELYKTKDTNAARVCETILTGGLKPLQVDPSVDFREKWREVQ